MREMLIQRDRIIAHTAAGRIVNRVGDRSTNAAQPELPLPGLTAPPVSLPKDEREPEPASAYSAKVEPAEEDLFVPSRPTPVPPYTPPSSSYGAKVEPTLGSGPSLRPGRSGEVFDRGRGQRLGPVHRMVGEDQRDGIADALDEAGDRQTGGHGHHRRPH